MPFCNITVISFFRATIVHLLTKVKTTKFQPILMFYMVSITIIALHGGPGKNLYGTIMTHRGPGKNFLRHNYNSPGSGKKILRHNYDYNSYNRA